MHSAAPPLPCEPPPLPSLLSTHRCISRSPVNWIHCAAAALLIVNMHSAAPPLPSKPPPLPPTPLCKSSPFWVFSQLDTLRHHPCSSSTLRHHPLLIVDLALLPLFIVELLDNGFYFILFTAPHLFSWHPIFHFTTPIFSFSHLATPTLSQLSVPLFETFACYSTCPHSCSHSLSPPPRRDPSCSGSSSSGHRKAHRASVHTLHLL